jgi:hypothetical protein
MKHNHKKTLRYYEIKLLTVILAASALLTTTVSAITFGEADGNGHPNVGAIVVDVPPGLFAEAPDGGLFLICSGTLVDPRVFLTAGHCTDFLNVFVSLAGIERVFVSFDKDNALNPAALLQVTDVFTHPGYNAVAGHGSGSIPSRDIGLLVLKDPVSNLAPATLPSAGSLERLKKAGALGAGADGARFVVVGYGSSLAWPPPQTIFPDGSRHVAESEFLAFDKSWLFLSQNPALGNGGTGNGDSGGPTLWVQPDGSEVLVSITSRGDPKLVATGVTYRIDTVDSLNFISDVIMALPLEN